MKLSNLRIGVKLGIAFGVLSAMVLGVATLSLSSLGKADANFDNFVAGIGTRIATMNRLHDDVNARAIAAHNLVIATSNADIRLETERVTNAHAAVQAGLALALKQFDVPGVPAKARELVADIAKLEQLYGPVTLASVDLTLKGNKDEAIVDMNEKCRPLLAKLETVFTEYNKFSAGVARRQAEASNEQYAQQRNILIAASVLSALMALIAAYLVTRSITVPVGQALKLAEAVAAGDLTQHVESNGKDEISKLLSALGKMNTSLVGIVSQVRDSSDSIATGSAQIASGNLDLSQRTEEQASALQQTSATMGQLNTTVDHNAENARRANQLALGANDVAASGRDVVAQVVSTMQGISASSHQIASITGVIDGIAFQTNILALNAAVEAARAGEQGRGFAVVATEVRSLSKRSAEAAQQIKALITASVEQANAGAKLAGQASATMDNVVGAIKKVTDIMGEISSASAEQSLGVSQVGQAVSQMDEVTQQNAALVEESAAAAESLKQQASQLVQSVSVFKLAGGDRSAPKVPVTPKKALLPRPAAASKPRATKTAVSTVGGEDWEAF